MATCRHLSREAQTYLVGDNYFGNTRPVWEILRRARTPRPSPTSFRKTSPGLHQVSVKD